MADGPLIVQSDKTLLLEVDHPERRGRPRRDRPVRRARARARARPHLPGHPLGAVERAGRRPRRRAGRRRAGALLPLPGAAARCSSTSSTRWTATGACGWTHSPVHGLVLRRARPGGARGGAAAQEDRPAARAPGSTTTPSSSTPPSAAGSSRRCSRSAGRPRTWPATSTARRTRSRCAKTGWDLRDYQREAVEGFWAGGSGVVVLPCGAGQDAGRCGRDGQGAGDHADPGHQHRRRAAVEAGAAGAHLAHRGRDRRVLRRAQGDPARSPSPPTR